MDNYLDKIINDFKSNQELINLDCEVYNESLDFIKNLSHYNFLRIMEAVCEVHKLIFINIFDRDIFMKINSIILAYTVLSYKKYNKLDDDIIIDYINSL